MPNHEYEKMLKTWIGYEGPRNRGEGCAVGLFEKVKAEVLANDRTSRTHRKQKPERHLLRKWH